MAAADAGLQLVDARHALGEGQLTDVLHPEHGAQRRPEVVLGEHAERHVAATGRREHAVAGDATR